MQKRMLFTAILVFLAACADHVVRPTATMYDPVTKTTKICSVNDSNWGWDDGAVIARCMSDYERAGYVQIPNKK